MGHNYQCGQVPSLKPLRVGVALTGVAVQEKHQPDLFDKSKNAKLARHRRGQREIQQGRVSGVTSGSRCAAWKARITNFPVPWDGSARNKTLKPSPYLCGKTVPMMLR